MTPVDDPQGKFRHWNQQVDQGGICWWTLNRDDASANTLSQDVLAELNHLIEQLPARGVSGLVIRSGKAGGFILGADVREFSRLGSAEEGAALAAHGQAILARIESLTIPTVAAIEGFALGGGLELALACRYRVAVEGHQRNLGLPEVQLGIHPGFGGTVRAVRLLGPLPALDLMLTGRLISPVEALSLGLVDRLTSSDNLAASAEALIREQPQPRTTVWYQRVLNLPPVRVWLGRRMRARVMRRARPEHYPAPHALIDLWVRHGGRGGAAYRAEARSIGQLLVTSTCRNLVRVFLLRERLRNLAPRECPINHVHVVGAGVMGGDIAAWCALRGLTVTLQDQTDELVQPALARARQLFKRRLRAPGEVQAAETRLTADAGATQLGDAQLLIEAIVERVDAKRALLSSLEDRLTDETLVATNTSSIVLEEISSALKKPQRFVGLHFFNPVAKLPLVEVISGEQTSEATRNLAMSFVTKIGKLPLPCRSSPGFLVNRILMPYMLEALQAHEDGYALETIDAAATQFGMPVGPIELSDRVGLDVALHVAGILGTILNVDVPTILKQKVEAGKFGAKSGSGFYDYDGNKARKQTRVATPDPELTDRLILRLLNEAVACYQERIVDDLDLLDAGVVFGTGFAPHTGGPINYAREVGIDSVIARMEQLRQRHGVRFKPHAAWRLLQSGS